MHETQPDVRRPLLCEPLFVPTIWGGRKLETLLGKRLPPGQPVGESWEVADIPEGTSRIGGPEFEGLTVRALMERHAPSIAPHAADGRFPLLVKFIDAEDDLSIQVHPDAEACKRFGSSARPKDECWVIVHAAPGAHIVHGFREGVTRQDVAAAVEDGTLLDCLRRVPVKPGNVIYVPAGTVHSLGSGIILLEIQQPSDTTFRLYDHGRGRELRIAQGLEALRLDGQALVKAAPIAEEFNWGARERLTPAEGPFMVERLNLVRPVTVSHGSTEPVVVVALSGSLRVRRDERLIQLSAGQTCIIPACLPAFELGPEDRTTVVLARSAGTTGEGVCVA